MYINVNRSVGV